MKRKQITAILLSFVLAASAFCSPVAQVPAFAAEEAVEEELNDEGGVQDQQQNAESSVDEDTQESSASESTDVQDDADVPASTDIQVEDDTSVSAEEEIEEADSIQGEAYSESKDSNTDDFIIKGTVSVTMKDQEIIPEAGDGKSSEELFAEYVDKSFSAQNGQSGQAPSGRKRAPKSAASSLTGIDRAIYDEIAACLPAIAAGERASTEFEIDVDDLGLEKTFWTAGELGISTILAVDESGNIIIDDEGYASISAEAIEAIDEITSYDLFKIIRALLADHPYQLYWYEKTQKTISTGYEITALYDDTIEDYLVGIDGVFAISLPVADEYSAGEYMVDTSIGQAVQTSVENANDIVDEHSGETDIEKLCSYRDEICSLVSYNYEAADGGAGYGNPWQMIWVFDGDPGTNVVCEGYSKAFQYLCNQSDFSDENTCAYSVSGTMTGGTGAGPHMWNIVTLDDRYHYLADITNSDSGTAGEDGELFLAPYTSGSVQDGYTFTCSDGTDIHYAYEEDVFSIYSTDDLTIAAYAYGKVPLEITSQPQDVSAEAGETVVLHVEANKSNVTYQWQWKTDSTNWKNCTSGGYNSDTFSFTMKETLAGRLYRCKVTGNGETLMSEAARISLPPLEITIQPQDVNAEAGETVILHVGTNTGNVTYQWQWSMGGTTWKNCTSGGYNTDTFSFKMIETLSGRQYRCKVTCEGKTLISEAAQITLLIVPLEITTQPQDVNAEAGETVVLHVEANKSNVTYQWQWSINGTTWKNCSSGGYNTDTFSFTMKETLLGRLYRCRVSDGEETLISEAAQITLLTVPLEITSQPQDVNAEADETVVLHVEANKSNVTYQWQWSINGTTWKNCTSGSYNTDTFRFTMKATLAGRRYRCKVTFAENTLISDSAMINLKAALIITEQPSDVSAAAGETVRLHIGVQAAESASVLYQWQWSSNGTTWKNCASSGYNTDTFSFKMKETLNNRLYRCKVTLGNDSIVSENALITFDGNGLLYSMCGEDGIVITGYDGTPTEIVIPQFIDGLQVKRIEDIAFSNNHGYFDGLLSVELPEGLESIGYYAFNGCINLSTINLPDSLVSIEAGAFYNCPLTGECLTLPDRLEVVEESAFSGTRYESIVVPDSVQSIKDLAFDTCVNLHSIELPSGLMEIGESAFRYCYNLEDVYYRGTQDEWEDIEIGEGNYWLVRTHIIFSDGEQASTKFQWYIQDGVLYVNGQGESEEYVWAHSENGTSAPWNDYRDEITKVVVGEGITAIYGAAFVFFPHLTEVVLPSTLKKIGNTVFDTCIELETITIPEGVESIGECAFWNCLGLKTIYIPDTVTSFGQYSFAGCALTDIYFSGTAGQWRRIEGLQSAEIIDTARLHFGTDELFCGDFGYVVTDGECAVTSYKGSDMIVTVPDIIEDHPVTEININPLNPDGTGNEAVFRITEIHLPNSVRKLGEGAFRDWTELKTITGLGAVQYVGDYCFSGSGVESLEFTEELSWAGLYAFDANDLSSITIPDTLRWVELGSGSFSGKSPFLNHENLETIQLISTGDTPTLSMDGPALYTADMVNLVCYPCKNSLRTYRIPDGVQLFYPRAFDIRDLNSTDGLYEIYVPSSVTGMYRAFYEIYTVMPDGTTECTVLPRQIVEEGSDAHHACLNGEIHYYWRLAESE